MKILLIHHNASNLGDVAIAEATINQLRKQFDNCEILLESSNPQLSKKYFKGIVILPRLFDINGINHTNKIFSFEFVIKNIPFLIRTSFAYAISLIFIIFRKNICLFPILIEYKNADLILSIAGDSISQDYAYFLRFYEIWLLRQLKKIVILYAQSIGPFTKNNLKYAKKYLSMVTAIFARDKTTYKLMKQYGINTKIFITADTVISLSPRISSTTKSVINKYSLNKNVICMVIRTLKYTNYSLKEYGLYLNGMKIIVDKLERNGFKLLFIASIPEDALAAVAFSKSYHLNNPILKLYDYMPSEVKTILSKVKLLISPRMHPIILAASMDVPAIGIGREFKMKNFMQMIGLKELFIDMAPFSSKKALLKLNKLLVNYKGYKKTLKHNIVNMQYLSYQNVLYADKIYHSYRNN